MHVWYTYIYNISIICTYTAVLQTYTIFYTVMYICVYLETDISYIISFLHSILQELNLHDVNLQFKQK